MEDIYKQHPPEGEPIQILVHLGVLPDKPPGGRGYSSESEGTPYRNIGQTVRDSGRTFEGMAPGGNVGEYPCCTTLEYPGKFNVGGIPVGLPPR